MSQLRVGNQHKMGPTGVHSLLLEMHTLHFNILQAQYAEALFEQVCGWAADAENVQSNLHAYLVEHIPSFGNFSDPQKYAGFVPSVRYLADMMNKEIESEEHDAEQHTACLATEQVSVDDSHKVCLVVRNLYTELILLYHYIGQQTHCEGWWCFNLLSTLDVEQILH